MELDRQSIEKRDFPIGRRGYDPAAVDAHLRALAAEVEQLQRAVSSREGTSLASTAGTQVQGILEAAEATAASIEHQALADEERTRAEADKDAKRTRQEAVERASAHVAAVSQATATLLERVESMDGEVGALVQSLSTGAGRLAVDLASVEQNMAELYDAASARRAEEDPPDSEPLGSKPGDLAPPDAEPLDSEPLDSELPDLAPPDSESPGEAGLEPPAAAPIEAHAPQSHPAPAVAAVPAPGTSVGDSDVDGARLIALNMALNGDSREQTDRYLADNFTISDRQKLLDEVYAAVGG